MIHHLGAVRRQHHFLRFSFGYGIGHIVTDVIGCVLVAPEEKDLKSRRSKQRDFSSSGFTSIQGKKNTTQHRNKAEERQK